jgi:hypothetical protein
VAGGERSKSPAAGGTDRLPRPHPQGCREPGGLARMPGHANTPPGCRAPALIGTRAADAAGGTEGMRDSPSPHRGSAGRNGCVLRRVGRRAAIGCFHPGAATLLFLVLARFSRQLPLLFCVVIIGFCQGVLLY